jgi:hypothetical protein
MRLAAESTPHSPIDKRDGRFDLLTPTDRPNMLFGTSSALISLDARRAGLFFNR